MSPLTFRRPYVSAGLVQICLAGVLWGTGGLGAQVVRRYAPLSPLTISAYRTAIAAPVLVIAVLLARQSARLRHLVRAYPHRVVVIGLATATYQALYFSAVVSVGISVATVIALGLAPVLLTLLDAVRAGSWPRITGLLPVAGALIGLVLVSVTSNVGVTGPHPALGVLAACGSGIACAAATALGGPLARAHAPLALTTASMTVGALVLVPAAVLSSHLSGGPLVAADPRALATLVYLGAATTALAYWLLYLGLRTTLSTAAVIATLLEPVTTAVVAGLVLGERLAAAGVVGTLLILAAVASLGRRSPQP